MPAAPALRFAPLPVPRPLVVGLWGFVAVLVAGLAAADARPARVAATELGLVALGLAAWAAWAPLIGRIVRRFPVEPGRFGRALGVHGACAAGVAALHVAAEAVVVSAVWSHVLFPLSVADVLGRGAGVRFAVYVLVYGGIAGALHAVGFYRLGGRRPGASPAPGPVGGDAYGDGVAAGDGLPALRAPLDVLVVPAAGGHVRLPLDEVDRLVAAGDYVTVHAGGRRYLVRATLKALEAGLDPARFVRVHRSAVVRAACVREVRPLRNGEARLVLADGADLRLSRTYRDGLARLLGAAAHGSTTGAHGSSQAA